MVKKAIKKKYIPNSKEKYMCAKHKKFFTEKLLEWRKEIIKSNNESAATGFWGGVLKGAMENMACD